MTTTQPAPRPDPGSTGFLAEAFAIITLSGYGHHLPDIRYHLTDLREMQDAYEQRVSALFMLRAELQHHGFNLATGSFPAGCVITQDMDDLLLSMMQLRERMKMNIAYMEYVDRYYKKLLVVLLDTPELWGQEQPSDGQEGCVIA